MLIPRQRLQRVGRAPRLDPRQGFHFSRVFGDDISERRDRRALNEPLSGSEAASSRRDGAPGSERGASPPFDGDEQRSSASVAEGRGRKNPYGLAAEWSDTDKTRRSPVREHEEGTCATRIPWRFHCSPTRDKQRRFDRALSISSLTRILATTRRRYAVFPCWEASGGLGPRFIPSVFVGAPRRTDGRRVRGRRFFSPRATRAEVAETTVETPKAW